MDTQREGLKKIAPVSGTIRERVVEILRVYGPMLDAELAERYAAAWGAIPHTTVLARRNELMKAGRVVKTGTRLNPKTNVTNTEWALA